MEQYINKSAVVAEIAKRIENCAKQRENMLDAQCYTLADDASARMGELNCIQDFLDKLEVKDPYEQCIQYPSIKDGIKAHAEIYSFNIESELFNQLTKEQQKLWRKEIEQACISGGEAGVEFARDTRYKENFEVKKNLTWQDIKLISEIGESFMNSNESDNLSEEEYYTEILRRFKNDKERNNTKYKAKNKNY